VLSGGAAAVSKGDPVCAQQRRLLERPSRRAFGAPQDEEAARFRQPPAHSRNQRSPFCVGSLLIPPGRRFPNPPQSNPSPTQQKPNPAQRKPNPAQRNPNIVYFRESSLFKRLRRLFR